MELDINPDWMSYMTYHPQHHPANPVPVNLLPTQIQPAARYYAVANRDFTAILRAVTPPVPAAVATPEAPAQAPVGQALAAGRRRRHPATAVAEEPAGAGRPAGRRLAGPA